VVPFMLQLQPAVVADTGAVTLTLRHRRHEDVDVTLLDAIATSTEGGIREIWTDGPLHRDGSLHLTVAAGEEDAEEVVLVGEVAGDLLRCQGHVAHRGAGARGMIRCHSTRVFTLLGIERV